MKKKVGVLGLMQIKKLPTFFARQKRKGSKYEYNIYSLQKDKTNSNKFIFMEAKSKDKRWGIQKMMSERVWNEKGT